VIGTDYIGRCKQRITAAVKFKTDIIASIAASLIVWAVILMIMYVETFKTDLIVFIGNIIMCSTSHWQISFQYQSQFVDSKLQINLIIVPQYMNITTKFSTLKLFSSCDYWAVHSFEDYGPAMWIVFADF